MQRRGKEEQVGDRQRWNRGSLGWVGQSRGGMPPGRDWLVFIIEGL